MTTQDSPASGDENIENLTNRLGRSPRPSEVAEQMDVELDEVIEAIAEHREPSPDQDPPHAGSEQPHP